ncbi:MAG: hypothetical protein ACMUFK_01100 [Thermoplasmatota archaeon]
MGRPDGTVVRNLPTYRRMMPYFLKHKYMSLYYWDHEFLAEPGLAFAERMSREYDEKVTYFHLFLHSLLKTFYAYPGVNRFVKGGKIYDRKGIYFSFSVKKEMTKEAKISIVKKEFKPQFTLLDTVKATRKEVKEVRSGKKDEGEKEAKRFLVFPGFLIKIAYPFYKFMDEYGLFTRNFIEKEVLNSSAFIANLGSFDCDAVFHHLYEVGTITNFYSIGAIREKVVAENGIPVVRKVCPVRATVDERGEDGFYYFKAFEYFRIQLEEPENLLKPCERIT